MARVETPPSCQTNPPNVAKPGPILDQVGRPPQCALPSSKPAAGDSTKVEESSVLETVKCILKKKQLRVEKREEPPKKATRPIFEAEPVTEIPVEYLPGLPDGIGANRLSYQSPGRIIKCAKMFVPEVQNYNFIGRIIGPRGMSVRRIEAETSCKYLIRGKGSVKDPVREDSLRGKAGWLHLEEPLHVLVACADVDEKRCSERLAIGVAAVQALLTPTYDEFKRQQLVQLALINGTYRP
ncbi:unnamed protein product [Bursaphelenchus okinawaensis]|uniref:K Homology domain-containing protein n=1 Tax=Bursaphelenchus okinawaensis TaxID=465554 RepID=A0A811KNT8_9BILA|nr:unnamed protein product [Bursaphelenchus okinawaensis]CAG9106930.1 unnamed protein product [Bursaphelenchus okinawaensis]